MDAKKWKATIKKQMTGVGTYREEFESPMIALAEILEQRDSVLQEYVESGSQALVETVSDRGAVNMRKNPLLQTWSDLNSQALAYWRDLGLTPAGLKKLNDVAMKEHKGSALEAALVRLSGSA